MPLLDKQHQAELIKTLYNLRDNPEMVLVRRLVEHRLEEAKDRLVVCQVQELQRHQGLAAAYQSLLSDLTRKVPEIPNPKPVSQAQP